MVAGVTAASRSSVLCRLLYDLTSVVAQLTKMCLPVGCRFVAHSSVAQLVCRSEDRDDRTPVAVVTAGHAIMSMDHVHKRK